MRVPSSLLAVAVGRTHARALLVERHGSPYRPTAAVKIRLVGLRSWAELLDTLLKRFGHPPIAGLGLALPGPVRDGRCDHGGLVWSCDEDDLRQSHPGVELVDLTNEVQATAEIVGTSLKPEHLASVIPGEIRREGPIGLLFVGTGVGMAVVQPQDGQRVILPSEGGHALFSPSSSLQIDLAGWFLAMQGRPPSVEDLLGGRGMETVHRFFHDQVGLRDERPWDGTTPFPTWILSTAQQPAQHACAAATLQEQARMLLAEAGNVALRFWATRGVYLCGSLPARLLHVLTDPRVQATFAGIPSGMVRPLLEQFPVQVIREDFAVAIGVAQRLQRRWSDLSGSHLL